MGKKVKRKKGSKKSASRTKRMMDNPLLQSTSTLTDTDIAPTTAPEVAPARGERKVKEVAMSAVEETTSIFDIVSDLERQLDAAFSIKDAQEEEIDKLKEQFEKAEAEATALDEKVKEFRKSLLSQEGLNSQLEFLENERLEVGGKIASLEKDIKQKSAGMKELERKMEALNKEIEVKNTRIEQIELELNSTNMTIQSFQDQISLLESEKEEMSNKLRIAEEESSGAIADRDKFENELKRAKESLDEIRLMLADTRAKAREHYYKRTRKKGSERNK